MSAGGGASGAGWLRVAAGLRMVAEAAVGEASGGAATSAERAARHGAGLLSSVRSSLPNAPTSPPAAAASPRASFADPKTANGWTPTPTPTPPPSASAAASATAASDFDVPPPPPATAAADVRRPSVDAGDAPSSTGDSTSSIPTAATASSIDGGGAVVVADANRIRAPPPSAEEQEEDETRRLREGRAVPTTRFGRAAGFAGLGLGLAAGTAAEAASRLFGFAGGTGGSGGGSSSLVVNDANSDRLAASLCRMRGAALKMGQMLSIQDESLQPPALSRALKQVRQGADAMPRYQLHRQLEAQLGRNWHSKFVEFDPVPFAAASIGQVHRAKVRRHPNDHDDDSVRDVVVKVQYPGVGSSIESDLRNLAMLVKWTGLAPPGLFIENVIRVGQQELKVECDYRREMLNQKRIQSLVESDPVLVENRFAVPDVIDELTTDEIITSEYMPGGTIDKVSNLDQDERNRIGRTILYLTMRELFDWRFMQTDPNWGNFLYDVGSGTTSLIDFGATREYSKDFVDGYLRIVWASSNHDEQTLFDQSHKMNFLTGDENEAMMRAHKLSGFTVGEPFMKSDGPFDFRGSNISTRMGEHTAVFLRHRLTPPPEEVYTLHRKLAGAYMLCIKLGAVIHCRDMLEDIVRHHHFTDGMDPPEV